MDSIKKSHKRDFTIVNNHYLKDKNLSWKAKGLITYIMMLPDDWNLNMRDLQNRSKDGRDSLYSGMKEIIESGYCIRKSNPKVNNLFNGYCYTVSDIQEYLPRADFPCTDNQDTGKQEAENPQLLNTNEQKTNLTNTKSVPENDSSTLFPEVNPNKNTLFRNSIYGNDTDGILQFKKVFDKPDYTGIDIEYYYHAVKDWSDSANKKRTLKGWIATARNFMRGDKDKNNLKMIKLAPEKDSHKEALEYLNGYE